MLKALHKSGVESCFSFLGEADQSNAFQLTTTAPLESKIDYKQGGYSLLVYSKDFWIQSTKQKDTF